MPLIYKLLGSLVGNLPTALGAVLIALLFYTFYQADQAEDQVQELELDVYKLEIQVEADEVRSRPVPDDRAAILDRLR